MDKKEIVKKLNLKVEKFEDFRKENNLSKRAFCKLCNISTSTYEKILKSESDFYLNTLFKILRVSNLQFCDII